MSLIQVGVVPAFESGHDQLGVAEGRDFHQRACVEDCLYGFVAVVAVDAGGFDFPAFVAVVAAAGCLAVDDLYVHIPSLRDRKSTRLNSSHLGISYAVFCLKKK